MNTSLPPDIEQSRNTIIHVAARLLEVVRLNPPAALVFEAYLDAVELVFETNEERIPFRREKTLHGFSRLVIEESKLDLARRVMFSALQLGRDVPIPIQGCTRDEFILAVTVLLVGGPADFAVMSPGGEA